jgi:chemotaxis protein methyltransferase CheR
MQISLSKDEYQKICDFVYRKSGIFLDEKHYDKIVKKLEKRYDDIDVSTFRQYFYKLRFDDNNGKEIQELMNAITVNETYFFREKYQFEVLVKYILPELDKIRPVNQPLRILSSPCSTGEEAYSIAIYLMEDDNIINRRDIEIIGIDINSSVITKARSGIYNDRSVHDIPKPVFNKYFQDSRMGYKISQDITDAIRFDVVNVFDKKAMKDLGQFDVIFSRNMLIYFDDASRKEVAMTFYDILKSGGYVLLGHAEYMNRIVSVFNVKKFDTTLVYQK